ncbi:hypothetical protein [Pseudomonas chlororaphis]|uniref:hypothetical protein n=1 Tax=Pseudomonas chlororaphis TaxID=587753 RepID=UPI0015DF867E|nr:hypothetical protein [Pseudomonas chlororaphis]QLL11751.1 hypothetical protein H0I86_22360 [Pseudomonas chlororaphis subsp. aurantiaca]
MSRYPYTEAYDALRALTDWKNGQGITFSRSEAARVCEYIAAAIGLDKKELAEKIADHARILDAKS